MRPTEVAEILNTIELRRPLPQLLKTDIGVYHERLVTELHYAGFWISLANSHRSRDFARGMGIMTKTDKVDAYMLACYEFLKKPHSWEPPVS